MNTVVKFELAKLLKEKGFNMPTYDCYNLNGLLFSNGWCEYIADDCEFDGLVKFDKLKEKDVLAPTIAEVVMWLYEKHGVWVSVHKATEIKWANNYFNYAILSPKGTVYSDIGGTQPNTPTEAYSKAIEYTLNNLL